MLALSNVSLASAVSDTLRLSYAAPTGTLLGKVAL
jgi:hypothetical protein